MKENAIIIKKNGTIAAQTPEIIFLITLLTLNNICFIVQATQLAPYINIRVYPEEADLSPPFRYLIETFTVQVTGIKIHFITRQLSIVYGKADNERVTNIQVASN